MLTKAALPREESQSLLPRSPEDTAGIEDDGLGGIDGSRHAIDRRGIALIPDRRHVAEALACVVEDWRRVDEDHGAEVLLLLVKDGLLCADDRTLRLTACSEGNLNTGSCKDRC